MELSNRFNSIVTVSGSLQTGFHIVPMDLEIIFLLMVESAYREEECPCPPTQFCARSDDGYQAELAKYLGRATWI